DGFYEWKAVGARKQPYFIHAKTGAPLAFAGLWETWIGPNGEEFDSAAIVTTSANHALGELHNRMPVIVPPQAFDVWLGQLHVEGNDDLAAASALFAPAPEDLLEVFAVSTDVNRVANDNANLLPPVTVSDEPESAPKPKRAKAAKPAKPEKEKPQKDDKQGALF
ncbi:MAG: SOS response-associated peptidase, partial [Bradyrhizobium sp.]